MGLHIIRGLGTKNPGVNRAGVGVNPDRVHELPRKTRVICRKRLDLRVKNIFLEHIPIV